MPCLKAVLLTRSCPSEALLSIWMTWSLSLHKFLGRDKRAESTICFMERKKGKDSLLLIDWNNFDHKCRKQHFSCSRQWEINSRFEDKYSPALCESLLPGGPLKQLPKSFWRIRVIHKVQKGFKVFIKNYAVLSLGFKASSYTSPWHRGAILSPQQSSRDVRAQQSSAPLQKPPSCVLPMLQRFLFHESALQHPAFLHSLHLYRFSVKEILQHKHQQPTLLPQSSERRETAQAGSAAGRQLIQLKRFSSSRTVLLKPCALWENTCKLEQVFITFLFVP